MKKKKLTILIVTISIIMPLLSLMTLPIKSEPELIKIRIGYLPYMNYFPNWIAEQKGWYKEHGFDVELHMWETGPPAMNAFAAGELDILWCGSTPVISAANRGLPLKIIWIQQDWKKGLLIMTRPDSPINTFKDLKGKRVIYHHATTLDYWFSSMCKMHGMSKEDMEMIHFSPTEALSAFLAGTADAYVAWPPQSFILLKQGYKVVASGPDLNKFSGYEDYMAFDQIIVHENFLKKHPEAVLKYLELVDRAINYYYGGENNIKEILELTNEWFLKIGLKAITEYNEMELLGPYSKTIMNLDMNEYYLGPKEDVSKSRIVKLYKKESEFWASLGQIPAEFVDMSKYIDNSFIFKLVELKRNGETFINLAEKYIEEAKSKRADVSKAEALLSKAKEAFGKSIYEDAIHYAKEAQKAAIEVTAPPITVTATTTIAGTGVIETKTVTNVVTQVSTTTLIQESVTFLYVSIILLVLVIILALLYARKKK